ncbi:hypothetical protein JCM19241_3658 [Vibrio ishigakensis]|uniref:Lipoprotein n=1 Tax=Vibrio ishigakensis TaxID=1481914 RepID=A0A0B8QAV8_9VIBR|nr:hypothetical protein JCM19241_3658 [Vibrio ishigakensis]
MKNTTIKTATFGVLIASALTGCVSTAVMQKSDEVASLPSMAVSVDGQFGGFGTEGTFDVAGLYKGKFTRDASSTDWFGVYGTAEGGLAAEITKVDSNQNWKLACHGDQGGLTLGGINMASSDPFECDILVENQKVGSYSINQNASSLAMPTKKELLPLKAPLFKLPRLKQLKAPHSPAAIHWATASR